MSTIGAIAAAIKADTHSLADSTTVYRCIIKAARFMRDKRLWFSEKTFAFNLQDGVAAYKPGNGPPADLVEVVGTTLWVLIGGSQDQRYPCSREPSAFMDYQRMAGTIESQPEYWDFHGGQLRFYPTPSSSSDVVEGRYVSDIGVPVTKWEAGAFTFYTPDGLRKLTTAELDAFANDWTDPRSAGDMVSARASHVLYKEFLRDAEMADTFLSTWLELVGQLETETEAKTAGATEIVPNILGGY